MGELVPLRDLTHQPDRTLTRDKAGESVTITEHGGPLAPVVPLRRRGRARPAVGYADSGDPTWVARLDDELAGFGE